MRLPVADRPYLRPTPRQREILAAYLELGTVAKAAAKLGMTVFAARGEMAAARKRTGMTTEQMIYAGARDGWITTLEITT